MGKGALKDLTGQRFGRLLVLGLSDKVSGKRKKQMWNCKCDCGRTTIALGESLKQGATMSCGCLYRETRGLNKQVNTYDLESYEYGIGFCGNGSIFIFDKEDYEKIKDFCWNYDGRYVTTHARAEDTESPRIIRMHRFVLGLTQKDVTDVDHKNRIRYDNRKSNLRTVSTRVNNLNKVFYNINKEIGIAGVRITQSGKYNASIRVNRKNINLGNYVKFEDARDARLHAEEKYVNHLLPTECDIPYAVIEYEEKNNNG